MFRLSKREEAITAIHWRALIESDPSLWRSALSASAAGRRVLIASSMGAFQQGAVLESVLAAALTLRGAHCDILLCDSFLPACQMTKIGNTCTPKSLLTKGARARCRTCESDGRAMFEPLGLKIHALSKWVTKAERAIAVKLADEAPFAQIPEWTFEGLAAGEHAMAGALRFYGRGDLIGEPLGEPILRRYLQSALLCIFGTRRLLAEDRYDVACFNHGIYVPQGLIGEVCRQMGVRVVNWNPAYRRHCFIFSHHDTYHHTMVTESVDVWETMQWCREMEREILEYLKSRRTGQGDWIWFHDAPEENAGVISASLGLNRSLPCVTMLTSVMWDACLHYRSNAFPSMQAWVRDTIEYFKTRPDLQLVIRIHPAEVRGAVPSRQPMMGEIRSMFPDLPANVFIVPPEHPASTYVLAEMSDTVLIYNTKTGIEVAATGVPVIVAGEAWIRNKGFSMDAGSPDEYRQLLDRLPLRRRMVSTDIDRARRYAYHFFFRRMIPLPFIVSEERFRFGLTISRLGDLQPCRHVGLDVICSGILNESSFVYDGSVI